MNEWQPMETAPKDGTHVLAWRDSGVHIVRWSLGGFWYEWHAKTASLKMPPTHWMPLPQAPTSVEPKGQGRNEEP